MLTPQSNICYNVRKIVVYSCAFACLPGWLADAGVAAAAAAAAAFVFVPCAESKDTNRVRRRRRDSSNDDADDADDARGGGGGCGADGGATGALAGDCLAATAAAADDVSAVLRSAERAMFYGRRDVVRGSCEPPALHLACANIM